MSARRPGTAMIDLAWLTSASGRRLLPLIAAAGVLLLLIAGTVMVVHNEQSYREAKTQQVLAQAAILASTVAAALVFNDAGAAQEYVDALQADPQILAAAVYDGTGALFAGFSRDASVPLPKLATRLVDSVQADRLSMTLPVRQGMNSIGSVYLQTVVEPPSRRVERYAVIALLVTMAGLIFVVLGVTQRTLSAANVKLAAQGEDLARVNERLREQIEQRERVEIALRQSQKMEAIGQLTGGIAHDFNNLLQVIMGNLEAVQRRDIGGGDATRRMIATAARGAERAASLTQRLLAFSRRQPLNPKPLDLNKLVIGMSDLLYRTLGESIKIETVLTGGIWRVSADANQLENCLLNLCVNARDAMPSGGKLTLETANSFLDEAYAATHEVTPGQYVAVAVSDTGSGMTKEVMQKAFEPFFTTKDVGKGSGLGLSQVYGFIRQSGGHVKIYSEVGEGTTVKLYLPRLAAADEESEAVETSEVVPRGSANRVILVVEDDPDVRAHGVTILRELGYTVLEAGDGEKALRIVDARADIDLLFTDVGLPGGMNGRQLADEARRRRPALPVLFTTGYARNAIVHQGRLDPGVELIAKPFTYGALAAKVRHVLDAAAGGAGGAAARGGSDARDVK